MPGLPLPRSARPARQQLTLHGLAGSEAHTTLQGKDPATSFMFQIYCKDKIQSAVVRHLLAQHGDGTVIEVDSSSLVPITDAMTRNTNSLQSLFGGGHHLMQSNLRNAITVFDHVGALTSARGIRVRNTRQCMLQVADCCRHHT